MPAVPIVSCEHMQTISLNGDWQLYGFPQRDARAVKPSDLATLSPIPAQVPGNVELDLVRAGALPKDLYFADNILKVREYELHEWWYRRQFDAPPELGDRRTELLFEGVDCLATYWLNDEEIGRSENMFVPHRFDVTGRLRTDAPNVLTVRIASPILAAKDKEYPPALHAQPCNWDALWIRKAPHMYGWDIMCRAVSAGLWRPVSLLVHDPNEIKDLYFALRRLTPEEALLDVLFELDTQPELLREAVLRIQGCCGESVFQAEKQVFFSAGRVRVSVPAPRLWWPTGYGEPNLYQVTSRLMLGDELLAERRDSIGLRKAELIRTDLTTAAEPGEFLVKINDTPILCKGSNWVPCDAFHSRDAERYEQIFALFRESGCNIVRCWGGNVYEDHAFFELCDRHGLMVWQDFAMACARYPQAPEFLDTMRREAVAIVKKLRNHPSLVLWCGDNECDDAYARPADNRLTREVLPDAVRLYDPERPYVPSSPYHADAVVARGNNADLMPERHLWRKSKHHKGASFAEHTAHFVSEIGWHGAPNVGSIRRFIDNAHLWPWQENEQWITHATSPLGKHGPHAYRIKLMADLMQAFFGTVPDELEPYVRASQILQAEACKFFIEMTRLRKWRRTGIIWWNMIDGWPQFSDAVVDYYLGKKLAYHYIRRVQQPVCLMCSEPEDRVLRVVAGNDSRTPAAGTFRVRDATTDETLLEGGFETAPNENSEAGIIEVEPGRQRLFLIDWEIEGRPAGNHYLLGAPPFCPDQCAGWLPRIAELMPAFDPNAVGA